MKRILIFLFLFAATGTISTQAQYRQHQTVWSSSSHDNRGAYRWEIRERRVWIPTYRTTGVFGIGSRLVRGHYEIRHERVKVYMGSSRYKKGHPHGRPQGQYKKHNSWYDSRNSHHH